MAVRAVALLVVACLVIGALAPKKRGRKLFPRARRRRLHPVGAACEANHPTCNTGLECVCGGSAPQGQGRRLFGATAACACETAPSPPMAPSPVAPPPPFAPPPCALALLLANDNDRRDYQDTGFWTSQSTVGQVTSCGLETHDVKTAQYWSTPLGASLRIVLRGTASGGAAGTLLGEAVYPVLAQYQSATLYELMTGGSAVTFTGMKDPIQSSGSSSSWMDSRVGGGQQQTGQNGDLFLDYTNPLVANAQSGWNSHITQIRLCTTYKDQVTSNGHWFGGLGGYHRHNSWGSLYESMPSLGYCSGYNYYGSHPGNIGFPSVSGVSHDPIMYGGGTGCYRGGSGGVHNVNFAIFVGGS